MPSMLVNKNGMSVIFNESNHMGAPLYFMFENSGMVEQTTYVKDTEITEYDTRIERIFPKEVIALNNRSSEFFYSVEAIFSNSFILFNHSEFGYIGYYDLFTESYYQMDGKYVDFDTLFKDGDVVVESEYVD